MRPRCGQTLCLQNSGPLLDRIDLHVEITPVSYDELTNTERAKLDSTEIRKRVLVARAIQDERFKDLKDVYSNAQMPGRMVREVCKLSPEGLVLLKTAMERLQLSARALTCQSFQTQLMK